MASVNLKDVVKVYPNGFEAVHGVNLDIKEDEFMVFVGPSGCAKSTTLRMIAGLEDISSGQIEIGGKVVNNLEPKDRSISMVFQNYALYPHMTTYKNMAFGLKRAKLSNEEIDRRVKAASKRLELDDLLDRLPKQMSGGQKQRVAVGRAIVREPEVFLFDEPLSNLDAKLRVSLRVSIKDLHNQLKQEGKPSTMIYVTHDQTEAMTLGDRICVMEEGHIRQVDTPMNLYYNPINKFVATFIGSPSMNMIDSTICKDESGIYGLIKNGYGDRDAKIYFSDEKGKVLINNIGDSVSLGFRTEDVKYFNERQDDTLVGIVSVIERMGSDEFVYFETNGKRLISKQPPFTCTLLNIGDNFYYKVDSDKIHVFSNETGNNLFM